MRRRNLSRNKIVLVSRKLIMNKGKKKQKIIKISFFLFSSAFFFFQSNAHFIKTFPTEVILASEKSFFQGRTDDFWPFCAALVLLTTNLFGSRITQNILTSFSFKKSMTSQKGISFLCVYVEAQPLGILGGQDYSTFYNDVVCQKKTKLKSREKKMEPRRRRR